MEEGEGETREKREKSPQAGAVARWWWYSVRSTGRYVTYVLKLLAHPARWNMGAISDLSTYLRVVRQQRATCNSSKQ